MTLVWLSTALTDRDAHLDYIARNNTHAAIEQGDRIARQVTQLIEYLELGRVGRTQGTREMVISRTPFIVVYRIMGARVELLRVLHGALQWPPLADKK